MGTQDKSKKPGGSVGVGSAASDLDNKIPSAPRKEPTIGVVPAAAYPALQEEILKDVRNLLTVEDDIRKGLLRFCKYFLTISSALIVVLSVWLRLCDVIEDWGLLVGIAVVPVQIIGVLRIISKSLFSDGYRQSLVPLLQTALRTQAKISSDTGEQSK
jgi:hypothetical protein